MWERGQSLNSACKRQSPFVDSQKRGPTAVSEKKTCFFDPESGAPLGSTSVPENIPLYKVVRETAARYDSIIHAIQYQGQIFELEIVTDAQGAFESVQSRTRGPQGIQKTLKVWLDHKSRLKELEVLMIESDRSLCNRGLYLEQVTVPLYRCVIIESTEESTKTPQSGSHLSIVRK